MKDWASTLAPHYDTAERMLGVKEVPRDSDGQRLLREVGRQFGVEDTFQRTPVGVYFGKAGTVIGPMEVRLYETQTLRLDGQDLLALEGFDRHEVGRDLAVGGRVFANWEQIVCHHRAFRGISLEFAVV